MEFEKPVVAIVKCDSYEVIDVAVDKLMDLLGGYGLFAKAGQKVLIKPNLLSGKPVEKAVITHPSLIFKVAKDLENMGAYVCVGDSPALESLDSVVTKTGLDKILSQLNCWFTPFDDVFLSENEDTLFKRIELASVLKKVDGVINLAKLKTHLMTTLTLCVKNLFGLVPGKRKIKWHLIAGKDRERFCRLLLDIYMVVRGAVSSMLNIVDGVVAMEGKGPSNGKPRSVGVLVGGADALAVDVVTSRIIGVKEYQNPLLLVAKKMCIPISDIDNIEIVGEELEAVSIQDFSLPARSVKTSFGLPNVVLDFLNNLFFEKPYFREELCTKCGSCVEICPPHALIMGKNSPILCAEKCIRCFCCSEICPEGAVDVARNKFLSFFHRLF